MTFSRSTCSACGSDVFPDDRFCGGCGRAIDIETDSERIARRHQNDDQAGLESDDALSWDRVRALLQAATKNEFEIERELGHGGMAAVFLARDLELDRDVAIKVMSPALLHGKGMVERFTREARIVANLHHPNIVAIHGVKHRDDLHFFVMQLVPGRTLEAVLRDARRLPSAVVSSWMYQVGSALSYAHQRGVVHRDVKPGNILLNEDGAAFVTDFGIAKVATNPNHTQTGTVVGTPVYMSPEQCYAKELTGASDQYSLGVVAYEMLAGRPPFTGSSFEIMRAHTDTPAVRLGEWCSDVPAAMESAVMRMLAKKPEDRFASLPDALASLGARPLVDDDPLRLTLRNLATGSGRQPARRSVLTPEGTRSRPRPSGAVVAIAPPPLDLEPGATAPLRAAVRAATETETTPNVEWTTTDPSIVRVDRTTGVLTAVAQGSAFVSASSADAVDSVQVNVSAPRPAVVMIAAPPRTQVGDVLTASAEIRSQFDIRIDSPVKWDLTPTAGASLEHEATRDGRTTVRLRCVSEGDLVLTASCAGAIGRARVYVAPASGGQPVPPNDSVAAVPDQRSPTAADLKRGRRYAVPIVLLAVGGTALYLAVRSGGLLGRNGGAVSEQVGVSSPATPTPAGADSALVAQPTSDSGSTAPPPPAKPPSSRASVASSSPTRPRTRVDSTAPRPRSVAAPDTLGPGASTRVPGGNAAPSPSVVSVELAELGTMTVGETKRLTAVARLNNGAPSLDAVVQWNSSNTDVASVAADGLLTARAGGTATIRASVGDKSVDRAVIVRPSIPVRAAETPTRSLESAKAEFETRIKTQATVLVRALNAHDAKTVSEILGAGTTSADPNVRVLLERLGRKEAKLRASDATLKDVQASDAMISVDFTVRLTWTTLAGRARAAAVLLRGESSRSGAEWRAPTITIVGGLD